MPIKETSKQHAAEPVARSSDDYHKQLAATFQLIVDRNHGCTTPVEHFIETLVLSYGAFEEKGRGITLEWIENDMEDLRRCLPEAIKDAHFIAGRYPAEEQPAAQ